MKFANVDEATANILIYMATTDTSDKAFEDKIADAGAKDLADGASKLNGGTKPLKE